jgi:peptidoglycan/LPS O-acetylase OafA/YrhL
LYPVYLASIAVALTFVMIAQSAHLMWFGQTPNIRWLDILAHIGMIVPFDYTLYNGPIWSLIHEMRISLFFPLIYWAVRTHAAAAVGFFTVLSLSLAATHWHTVFAPKYPELVSVTATLHYTTLFVYGAAFAKQRALIVGTFAALPGRTALLAAVFFLLVYAYLQPDYHRIGPEWVIDLCVGAAACGIIALASSRIALEKYAAIRYLGKISFSLYLIHGPFILLILSTLSGRIGTPYVVGLSILASMWGADILWRLVETRALRWSREARRLSTAAVLVKEG